MLPFTFHSRFLIRFRRRRMQAFYVTFRPSAQTRVLDIGGAPNTWTTESTSASSFPVTLANIHLPAELPGSRFTSIYADATQLPFPNAAFDIAFSNSVIEHMTTWPRQQAFAAEARRVASRIWIQTPARSFPIESHFLAPFFQYIPHRLQLRMVRYLTPRGLMTKPTPAEVIDLVSDIRLLTYREMQQLFPDCTIHRERFLGLTKSYIAIRNPN